MPTSNNNRPSTYGTSNIVRSRTATQRRQDEALRLRRLGMTYIAIARELGFTPNGVARAQSAAEAVRAAERRERERLSQGAINAVASHTTTSQSDFVSNRTFGMEAEFFGITAQQAIDALAVEGITCTFEGYTHRVLTHWKIVTDGSVTSTGTGIGYGLELVSPILRGRQGIEEAIKVLDTIRRAGGKVNKTCGLHIHIGMNNLTGSELMKVVDTYVANQNNINRFLARSRHNNGYCLPFTETLGSIPSRNYSALRRANTMTETAGLVSLMSSAPKYRVVNLNKYSSYGTFEFRQHQGTLNGEKVASWVKFLMSLIEKATSMADASQDFGSLANLMSETNLSAETQSFLNRRAERLGGSRN